MKQNCEEKLEKLPLSEGILTKDISNTKTEEISTPKIMRHIKIISASHN